MITHLKIALAAMILAFACSPLIRAELSIESVYPNVGKIDEDLSVTIRGRGFDENTRVYMSLDTGNRKKILGSVDTPDDALGVAVVDTIAYVGDSEAGLQIIDVSDPENPFILGSVDTPGYARNVAVAGTTAYVADAEAGLQIIDVSDPEKPFILGSVDTPGDARDVAVVGTTAYVADGSSGGMQVVDAADPWNPAILGSVDTPGDACDVAVVGSTAYVADGSSNALHVVDISEPRNPAIIGYVYMPGDARSVAAVGTTAYVAAGWFGGLHVVDVADPSYPVIIGSVYTYENADDVVVMGTTAYVTNAYSGLQIIDVADPRNPVVIGSVYTSYADGVAVVGTTAYVANGCYGSLQVVDVAEPENRFFIGSVETSDLACDVVVLDTTAYVADMAGGLHVVDVADPRNPAILGSADTPLAFHVAVMDTTAYVAAVFGMYVVDVADPRNPAILASVDISDYNTLGVAVKDAIAYVANAEAGLQILDVVDPRNPVIIGSANSYYAISVAVTGTTAYVADKDGGLKVVDVADPRNPVVIGSVCTLGSMRDVAVVGATAYVTDELGLHVVDVADPRNPVVIGSVYTPGYARDVAVMGATAYVAGESGGLMVVDVADPRNPIIIDSVLTGYSAESVAVTATETVAYVADCFAGLTIVPVPHEIAPIQVIGPTELRVTLPGPSIPWYCNLLVFNQSESDELMGAVSFLEEAEYLNRVRKKAVVAAGSNGDPSDRLVVPVRTCANYAYLSLMSQGYSKDNIQFLAPHVDWDVDGDGALDDVDDVCTTATLSAAIAEWGADSSELLVFLVDHGGVGTFYANADDIVQASDLDAWMDIAQRTIPGKAVLIYDACHSGSFLAEMLPPSGKERIVVASSLSDELAWFMNDGALSFGYQFWASVFMNANLYESFVVARNMMAHDQTAVLDANGDGEQTKEDIELVRDFIIGRGRIAASTPPAVGEVSGEQVLFGISSANLWASDIAALNEIERVWAVIVPPDFDNSAGDEVTCLNTVELADPDQDGAYIGEYGQFDQLGTYDVFVYASDIFNAFSLPKATTVVVVDPNEEGIVYVHSSGDCGVGRKPCYDTVQQGLNETGRVAFRIEIAQGDYQEDLTVANDCRYTLSGGYDDEYENQIGLSAIIGSLAVATGTLEVENLALAGP